MPHRIPQSVALRVPLKGYLASDHISDATGLTPVIKVSKNGAAFADPHVGATNAASIGNGWYYVDLDATDTGTLGPVVIRATVATMDTIEIVYQVVDANTMGAAALPATGTLLVKPAVTLAWADTTGTVPVPTGMSTLTAGAKMDLADTLSDAGVASLKTKLGTMPANLVSILGTALTETAGYIAAAFKKFFNVATPTGTINSIPDAVPGAAGGLFIAGSNAATTISGLFSVTGGVNFTSSTGDALTISSSGGNGKGVKIVGNGTGTGLDITTGGKGISVVSAGGTAVHFQTISGIGLRIIAGGTAVPNHGVHISAAGTGSGLFLQGGDGDVTSHNGGDGLKAMGTNDGSGLHLLSGGTGSVGNGLLAENGAAGGVPIVGNITGNLSGSVGSVTSAIVLPTIPNNWIAAVGVKDDAVTKIQSGLFLAASYQVPDNADASAAATAATLVYNIVRSGGTGDNASIKATVEGLAPGAPVNLTFESKAVTIS
jgi:hypothetical protein